MDLAYLSRNANAARSARARIKRSGFTPNGHLVWSQEEEATIDELKPDYHAIKERLPHRSYGAIQARCRRHNVYEKRKYWTGIEQLIVRRLYSTGSREEIMAALPGRSWAAISLRAQKLSLSRRKPYKIFGVAAIDHVRAEAYRLNINMRELDKLAKTRNFFKNNRCTSPHAAARACSKALRVLGGELVVRWPPADP